MKRYFFRNKGLLAAAVSAALFLALTQTAFAFVLQIIIDAVTERDWTKLKYYHFATAGISQLDTDRGSYKKKGITIL